MTFKLCQCAQKRWIRLHSPERLADVVKGVKFVNGMEEKRIADKSPYAQLLTIAHITKQKLTCPF